MRLRERAAAVATSLAVAAGFTMAVSPAAHAGGYGCSGSLIDTYAVKSPVNTLSHVYLYYNSSTGYNCAVNVKTAYYSQFKHDISIEIYNTTLTEDNIRWGVNIDQDNGKYWQYAGPVKVKGRGMCISIVASTYYYDEFAHLYKSAQHCG
ncbi:hypothetical protein [Actinomadura latina]|uniref:Spore-associated protein A n=1 Tax=Actinomadura latina TaxID=163603 RepID=A0A846YVG8_9ACTN|nr:hypothetical protein [Actinomadura latina]NKZ02675.1 hypothetical protein [Actinomadura latina]